MKPKQPEDAGDGTGTPLKMTRSRWATRKLTVKSSGMKRLSLVARKHNRKTSTEKKRASGGSESLRQDHQDQQTHGGQDDASSNHNDDGAGPTRQVYFNTPLPPELKDEDGAPLRQYPRNKIRTAKYTPLTFVPKNLWFQFHNVANIFFLFVILLAVSSPWLLLAI
jgi:phospholipid-translocating ATPase